jgi:hypothetical protein
METVRWNVAVSPEVDQSVRMFIAAQGGGRKGDLSRFIEDAVRAYLFGRAVEQAKAATANMAESELNDLIDEAVQWAREPLPENPGYLARPSNRHHDQPFATRTRTRYPAAATRSF